MIVEEDTLGKALRANGTQERARRQRLRWIAAIGASYAVDTLFLAMFAAIGTIAVRVPLEYGLVTAAVTAFTSLAYARGWNLRSSDPSLTKPLMGVAIVLQLGVALAAPGVAFLFLANLFTVFAFGMLWLNLRHAVAVWLFGVIGAGVVFAAVGERIGAPTGRPAEVFLTWLFFSLILARCLLVSVAANDSRTRLAESRRKLGDTLEQVQRLSSRDELTRALNRRSLIEALERERARAERSGAPFCIAMIDMDHFKRINDSHGHGAGDAVLRGFSSAVHDVMRSTDVFGRYGGEEFLLILVGTEAAEALEAVERVRTAVAARDWSPAVPDAAVTISTGVAAFRKGEAIEQLLHRADQALYQAKRGGRNQTILNTP
jgi:diguanylate cyclase (GGDEF)-like protein